MGVVVDCQCNKEDIVDNNHHYYRQGMKCSIVFLGCLLVVFSSGLPRPGSGSAMGNALNTLGTKLGNSISKNVCIPGVSGVTTDTCPKPLQYCSVYGIPRCRWNGGAWFLFLGLPLILVIGVVAVVYYKKKNSVLQPTEYER